MDLNRFKDYSVIDCHTHHRMTEIELPAFYKQAEVLSEVVTKGNLSHMYAFGKNEHGSLYLKAKHPDKFYAGGYIPWTGETKAFGKVEWRPYIESLIDLGYDGTAEMGSKPEVRSNHTPLDSDYYKGFWESSEELEFPILCHIGDVEDFWYEETTPKWAKDRGWGYYRDDFPGFREFYAEIFNVLNLYPELKISLCHFLFMTPDIDEAEQIMADYPNVTVDLSPGVEFLYNISRKRDEWHDFMVKYDDRIVFGTDIGMSRNLQAHLDRVWLLRMFLETGEKFYTPETADQYLTRYEEPFIGLDLPKSSLEKIYSNNFKKFWGSKPRSVDLEGAIKISEKQGEKVVAEALKSLL
jgi:predicted TIM-barrel fold metal-dependent hydrolase